MTVKVTKIFVG